MGGFFPAGAVPRACQSPSPARLRPARDRPLPASSRAVWQSVGAAPMRPTTTDRSRVANLLNRTTDGT
jgi:hypothetical protein